MAGDAGAGISLGVDGRNGLQARPVSHGRPFSGRTAAQARPNLLGPSMVAFDGAAANGLRAPTVGTSPTTTASVSEPHFVPALRFQGAKVGYAFKNGETGTGYYRDDRGGGDRQMVHQQRPRQHGGGEIKVSFEQEKIGLAFVDRSNPLVIASIAPASAAAAELQLHPGLCLVAVQWQSVVGLTHEQTLRMLQSADRPLVLGFDHPPPRSATASSDGSSRLKTGGGRGTVGGAGGGELMHTSEELPAPLEADGQADRKPTKMSRAKVWDGAVEAAYRYQSAGWRDQQAYQSAHGAVTVWAGTAWPKVLNLQGAKDLMYFGKNRECAGSLCNRVKLYTYA